MLKKNVIISRDPGFPKSKLSSPERKKKSLQRINDPNIQSPNERIREFFAKSGIGVNPNAMTYLYKKK